MATGGEKDKGKGSSSSQLKLGNVGGTILVSGGAVLGVAALYGMKKLYDHFKTKKNEDDLKKEEDISEKDLGVSDSQPPLSRSMLDSPPTPNQLPSPDSPQLSTSLQGSPFLNSPGSSESQEELPLLSSGNLHDDLYGYYNIYVKIPELDYQTAISVVDEVKSSFMTVVEELMPNCPLGAMINIGPASEGLAVIHPDQFQVGLNLSLNPQVWELIDAGQTLLSAHGYQMVKRSHLEFFSRGTSFYDRYLIGEYLSPVKIKSAFLDLTNRVSNWRSKHVIQSAVVGPEVKLIVRYGPMKQWTLAVDFVPAVLLQGYEVLAEPHPRCKTNSCYENLWMQSFRKQEIQHLTGWKPPAPAQPDPPSESEEAVGPDADIENKEPEDGKGEHKSGAENEEMSPVDEYRGDDATSHKVSEGLIENLPSEEKDGCQLMCLGIMEAIRLNHPAQLRILTPYIVRTIIMTLMTLEDGWDTEQLSERFLDTLKLLEEFLRAHQVPHLFCPKMNLLDYYDTESIDQMREFLVSVIGNNQFKTLLKKIY